MEKTTPKLDLALENEVLKEKIANLEPKVEKLGAIVQAINSKNVGKTDPFTYSDVKLDTLNSLQSEGLNYVAYQSFRQSFFDILGNVGGGSNIPSNNSSNFALEFYLMILNRMAYFANMPNYQTKEMDLNEALIKCLQINAFFGQAILVRDTNKKKWFSPKNFNVVFNEYDEVDEEKSSFTIGKTETKLSASHITYFHIQLNYSKFGIWVLTYGYIYNVVNMLRGTISMANIFKNLLVEKRSNNTQTNASNRVGLYNWNESVIIALTDPDSVAQSTEEIFSTLKIDGANFPYIHSQIQYYLSFWDKEIGIRTNVETSQTSGARAITSEMLPTSFAIDKKEMEYYHYLDNFFQKINKKYPLSVEWNFPNLVISQQMTESNPATKSESGTSGEADE